MPQSDHWHGKAHPLLLIEDCCYIIYVELCMVTTQHPVVSCFLHATGKPQAACQNQLLSNHLADDGQYLRRQIVCACAQRYQPSARTSPALITHPSSVSSGLLSPGLLPPRTRPRNGGMFRSLPQKSSHITFSFSHVRSRPRSRGRGCAEWMEPAMTHTTARSPL